MLNSKILNSSAMYFSATIILIFLQSCKTRQFGTRINSINEQEKLVFLKSSEWPTAADYLIAFGKMPELEDKFYNKHHSSDFSQIPELIVALEKAFPKGNYYCVGRDVRLACEALDLFYRLYTSEERVGNIRGSGITFDKYRTSMQTLLDAHEKVLLSAGFDPEPFVKTPAIAKPFVIIDATSWKAQNNADINMSQARVFLKAAYSLVRKNGGNPTEILQKLGSLAINNGASVNVKSSFSFTSDYNVSDFFQHIKSTFSQFDHPSETLRMNLDRLSYGHMFWHEKYTHIEEDKHGKVKVFAGRGDETYRMHLFNRTIDLNAYFLSSEFRQKLLQYAQLWNVPHIEMLAKKEPQKLSFVRQNVSDVKNDFSENISTTTSQATSVENEKYVGEYLNLKSKVIISENDDKELMIEFELPNNLQNQIYKQVLLPNPNKEGFVFVLEPLKKCNFFSLSFQNSQELFISWHGENSNRECKQQEYVEAANPFWGNFKEK